MNIALIEPELERFRRRYKERLHSGLFVIDRVAGYLVKTQGKGLRPTLTLLAASLNGSRPPETAIQAAVIVELLHEATLVHDDVVDESATRRGWPSLPAKFRNKIAVLFGDYMLATVLAETLEARDLKWLDVLSHTARRMARGELVQASGSRRLDLSTEEYLKMISDKTGALFSAGCRLGGLSCGLADDAVKQLGLYGEHLGVAFQIRDDLLDLFGSSAGLGKPLFGDLKQRKLTLPLLTALGNSPPREAGRIRARIRRGLRFGEAGKVADFVRKYGGEESAIAVMEVEAARAAQALNGVPTGAARDELHQLVTYAMRRSR